MISNEAKSREKHKLHYVNKQLRKKELLMQPMDDIKSVEPSNPLREK